MGVGEAGPAVIDGLEADVVTLALANDIDAIAGKGKLLPDIWQSRLANNSSPIPRPSCSWSVRGTEGDPGLGRSGETRCSLVTPTENGRRLPLGVPGGLGLCPG